MTSQRASGRKQARRIAALGRQRRMLQIKQSREALIPNRVLKALAALHLPRDPKLYTAKLQELLRGV
jgi:hypothetical protein